MTFAPRLGREAFDDPVLGLAQAVDKPIMQAVGAALPELDLERDDAIAAPVWGAGDLALAVGVFDLSEAAVEIAAAGDDGALARGPGADLAAARAGGEVGVRFLLGRLHYRTLDAHLAFEGGPEE